MLSLNKNDEYDETSVANLWKRYDAPRTMGSGFAVLQNPNLRVVYRQSVFVNTKTEPICDLNIDLGENVRIAYGPWAESCRLAFINYFFPTDYSAMTPTVLPKNGEKKILAAIDITLTTKAQTSINFWFMRRDELNAVATTIKNGCSLKIEYPMIITDQGYKTTSKLIMKDVHFLPTSAFRKLFSCEELTMEYDMHFPLRYGQLQNRVILFKINSATTWFVWDHVVFFEDLLRETTMYNEIDLAEFVPQIWDIRMIFNDMTVAFVTNDKNWVDASNPMNNFLIALVAKQLTISSNLNNTDFCPKISKCNIKIASNDKLVIKFHVPQQSTLSPLIHTLYNNSYYYMNNLDAQKFSKPEGGWVNFLRTEEASLTCDYTWHSIYYPYISDLPIRTTITWNQKLINHPFELEPDSAFIEIAVNSPELFISGFALKIIENFIDDYFGLYIQVSNNSRIISIQFEIQNEF
ncbi:unnamed protein product [Thelazia callipaeda]|uniref:Neur_chan_LBD domain-containing protein n=1 Tax=Thelazia callipaeda TaxID=103827 RepID=A0A0N5DCD4_THECL|nr:unnamed protein product [Thelazia callipaeda]